eukprot:COSAG02_NODE_6696_length_3415_cov_22.626055_3_plen_92_part_00
MTESQRQVELFIVNVAQRFWIVVCCNIREVSIFVTFRVRSARSDRAWAQHKICELPRANGESEEQICELLKNIPNAPRSIAVTRACVMIKI